MPPVAEGRLSGPQRWRNSVQNNRRGNGSKSEFRNGETVGWHGFCQREHGQHLVLHQTCNSKNAYMGTRASLLLVFEPNHFGAISGQYSSWLIGYSPVWQAVSYHVVSLQSASILVARRFLLDHAYGLQLFENSVWFAMAGLTKPETNRWFVRLGLGCCLFYSSGCWTCRPTEGQRGATPTSRYPICAAGTHSLCHPPKSYSWIFPTKSSAARWFKVTFWFPSWRSPTTSERVA